MPEVGVTVPEVWSDSADPLSGWIYGRDSHCHCNRRAPAMVRSHRTCDRASPWQALHVAAPTHRRTRTCRLSDSCEDLVVHHWGFGRTCAHDARNGISCSPRTVAAFECLSMCAPAGGYAAPEDPPLPFPTTPLAVSLTRHFVLQFQPHPPRIGRQQRCCSRKRCVTGADARWPLFLSGRMLGSCGDRHVLRGYSAAFAPSVWCYTALSLMLCM